MPKWVARPQRLPLSRRRSWTHPVQPHSRPGIPKAAQPFHRCDEARRRGGARSRHHRADDLGVPDRRRAASEYRSYIDSTTLLEKVSFWVGSRLNYVPGSSDPIDGAVDTLLSGAGVCRDFAHLVVALLRAVNVPARVVSVYAPGLYPMDFHAVAEAFVEGHWRVVDGTLLAPRQSLVRIATGRDAADIAFLDNHKGAITLNKLVVTAVVDGDLPRDSIDQLVSIS